MDAAEVCTLMPDSVDNGAEIMPTARTGASYSPFMLHVPSYSLPSRVASFSFYLLLLLFLSLSFSFIFNIVLRAFVRTNSVCSFSLVYSRSTNVYGVAVTFAATVNRMNHG